MHRSHHRERLQDHQVEPALEDVGFRRADEALLCVAQRRLRTFLCDVERNGVRRRLFEANRFLMANRL
jgi:hypothetical protein